MEKPNIEDFYLKVLPFEVCPACLSSCKLIIDNNLLDEELRACECISQDCRLYGKVRYIDVDTYHILGYLEELNKILSNRL